MKKYIISSIFCLLLSIGVVIGLSYLKSEDIVIKGSENEKSLVSQAIISYTSEIHEYYKLYREGKLIGVLSSENIVSDELALEHEKYKDEFPNINLVLDSSVYLVKEASNTIFENVDDDIIDYLKENDLFGFEVYQVEITKENNYVDTIYILSIDDFVAARDKFILNFVDEEILNAAKSNEKISGIESFGSKDIGVYINDKFSYKKAIVSADEIFKDEDDIYEYFCYGRDETREYYTINKGDTLEYVGYYHGLLTPKQIYSLNKDVLSSPDQILAPGTILNVTYFKSPIDVVVTKQRYIQEKVAPQAPVYVTKYDLSKGEVVINIKEITGLKNVIYEENWVNGNFQSDIVLYSETIREAQRGEVWLGLGAQYVIGTGDYIWPVDYGYMTADYESYTDIYGNIHSGIDLINIYNRSGPVYAADTGTVYAAAYDPIQNGNYVIINHNNGYQTIYGHMRDFPMVQVGQAVNKGDQIGWIGSTGLSSGRHLHWGIFLYWSPINPCNIMDCSVLKW